MSHHFPNSPNSGLFKEALVLCNIEGRAGIITLNRPQALNALNVEMIERILSTLSQWEEDPRVVFIVIQSCSEKAFCAGGDIKSVYEARLREDWAYMDQIFRLEYQMNHKIKFYKKPIISLIKGICMGGGMGLSIHGSHRVITDDTVMAMPEAAIGFFTDVGASYFLNTCPGNVGMMMGLTGERLTRDDCLYTGLATHYIPQGEWSKAGEDIKRCTTLEQLENMFTQLQIPQRSSYLETHQELIDECFSGKTVEEIFSRLEKGLSPQTMDWLKKMEHYSPSSLKIIHHLLNVTKGHSLTSCLKVEFRVGKRFMNNYDFFEGVRALLIDKDQKPSWQPSHLYEVEKSHIAEYFEPLGEEELFI